MRGSKPFAAVLVSAIALTAGARVSAHRLDEFLQAARIAIERDRVKLELSLTPGIAVAGGVIRDVDSNRDGVLSSFEQAEYAAHVLSGMTLSMDEGQPLRLTLKGSRFPDLDAIRTGDGIIAIQSEAEVPHVSTGVHRLVLRNDTGVEGSVYLANALAPDDDAIAVTRQERDSDQRELSVEFTVNPADRQWIWIGLAGLLIIVGARGPRKSS